MDHWPMLKSELEKFVEKVAHDNFKSTDCWVAQWKMGTNSNLKRLMRKKMMLILQVLSIEFQVIAGDVQSWGISVSECMQEDEVSHRSTPDGSLSCKLQQNYTFKKSMGLVTILGSCNEVGSDKCKLLVIGKTTNPLCFKNLRQYSVMVLGW